MVNFRQLLQDEMTRRFMDQDPATGNFDVIFQLADKLLYANRCMFVGHSKLLESQTLAVMKSNEVQTVASKFQYEEFYQLMFFLYSGKCDVTPENAVRLMEVAHFYSVDIFKMYLEEIIREWEFNWNTVFQYLAAAKEYSMNTVIYHLSRAVFEQIAKTKKWSIISGVDNTVGYEIVEFARKEGFPDGDLFEFAFRWTMKRLDCVSQIDPKTNFSTLFRTTFAEVAPGLVTVNSFQYEYIHFAVEKGRGLFTSNHVSDLLDALVLAEDDVIDVLNALVVLGLP